MNSIRIGKRIIGPDQPPFIIAELSGNHGQDFELACQMVDQAAAAGAHAIKLQTYTADSMTLNVNSADFVIQEKDSLWYNEALHGLYAKASTPYEWHKPLFERAQGLGMEAFSSPFDEAAVDFLDELGVPCFKIASFELTDIPLIRKAASKGKPLIMSTGMASIGEIEEAVKTAKENGCNDIILLKCTSTYPALPINTNLNTIANMRDAFGVQVGLSDHTAGVGVSVAATALGATVIEKHFVLDRSAGGVLEPRDHAHRRGLAAARGAQQHQKLLVRDGQVEVVHADKAAPALVDVAKLNFGHAPPLARHRPGQRSPLRCGKSGF